MRFLFCALLLPQAGARHSNLGVSGECYKCILLSERYPSVQATSEYYVEHKALELLELREGQSWSLRWGELLQSTTPTITVVPKVVPIRLVTGSAWVDMVCSSPGKKQSSSMDESAVSDEDPDAERYDTELRSESGDDEQVPTSVVDVLARAEALQIIEEQGESQRQGVRARAPNQEAC